MNYTMQLEGKLQSIHSEVDRLNARLEGMQGQGKLLLKARAELEQQVRAATAAALQCVVWMYVECALIWRASVYLVVLWKARSACMSREPSLHYMCCAVRCRARSIWQAGQSHA